MQILGLESSCDETGTAIYCTDKGLLAHALHSQVDLHALYGGVVPELASRDHIRRLVPLVDKTLSDAGVALAGLDGVAYTAGPGLSGALLAGALFSRSLAYSAGLPAIGVHHMEGHLLAPMLEPDPPVFPFICLLVSGGHTLLVRVDAIGQYRVIGESVDDAAGEAFDKTAKMLGLPYPGGPHLAALAESGDQERYAFPRPMTNRPGLDFSFSGLKTAAITEYATTEKTKKNQSDIAASFQKAVVETLLIKCKRALKQEGLERLVVSGGVSANRSLRERSADELEPAGISVAYPRLEFCTDNGAMIALAGAMRLKAGQADSLGVGVKSRWSLEDLVAV